MNVITSYSIHYTKLYDAAGLRHVGAHQVEDALHVLRVLAGGDLVQQQHVRGEGQRPQSYNFV